MLDKGRILPLKVLVKEIEREEKVGHIIIAPIVKEPTIAGEVILVGDSTSTQKMVVEKGDNILHSPHSFVSVEIDGKDYRLLNQTDVLFIWK